MLVLLLCLMEVPAKGQVPKGQSPEKVVSEKTVVPEVVVPEVTVPEKVTSEVAVSEARTSTEGTPDLAVPAGGTPARRIFGVFNVRDFGAKGDGISKDTDAIQQAIDACAKAGGGTVLLPAGTYVSGSIYLKSNTEFQVGAGAILLASPDREDYNPVDVCPQNEAWEGERSWGAHLILCIEQENVTVSGPGIIDGNSPAFLLDKDGNLYRPQAAIPWRPSQMLYFVECQNVRVRDIELRRSSYWSCFFHGCTHVMVHGAKVSTERFPHTFSGDGVDVDCCRFVTISDCFFDTADDCLTLRADSRTLKHKQPTEFVTVTNCTLSTPCNAIRLGVGDAQIRHAVFSNLVIYNTRTALNLISTWTADLRGVDIEDVRFQNLNVECQNFLYMALNETHQATIRNVFFSGIHGSANRDTALILGNADQKIENVQFSDIDIAFTAWEPFMEISHVKGLVLRNCRIYRPEVGFAADGSPVNHAISPEIRLGEVEQLRSSDCEPALHSMTPEELEKFNARPITRW